jgi:SAM-dependent methyltransferase
MSHGSPLIFCERFDPDVTGSFDAELDRAVVEFAKANGRFAGRCNLSAMPTEFTLSSENIREDLVASVSGSTNRQRQVVAALAEAMLGRASADLAEVADEINRRQLSLYIAESLSLPAARLRELVRDFECSEYFGDGHRSGDRVGEVLHQDLQATSFADEQFDIVITSEVLEHVPDALAAEREICRILKRGGLYCFTVPFLPYHEHDILRAEAGPGGAVVHHLEPQYHGDPIRPEQGILVYRLFSHRDLRARFEALGCTFTTYRLWSKALGILGDNCMVMVARKAGPRVDVPPRPE